MTNNWRVVEEARRNREAVLDAVDRLAADGQPSTRENIAAATGIGVRTVQRHVRALVADGTLVEDGRTVRLI